MDPILAAVAEIIDDTQVRRSAPRFALEIPARYQIRGEEPIAMGMIQNISKSGALVDDKGPGAPVGSRLRLSFSLFPDSHPLQFSAEIVRIANTGFAVRFTDTDPRNRKLLEAALPVVAALKERDSRPKL